FFFDSPSHLYSLFDILFSLPYVLDLFEDIIIARGRG
ncbi:uncharacterized, partial [Tachysurus ichikawai]